MDCKATRTEKSEDWKRNATRQHEKMEDERNHIGVCRAANR